VHVVSETLGDDELTWDNTRRIPGVHVCSFRPVAEASGERAHHA